MSHLINLSIGDCKNILAIKERLENEQDSKADEEEIRPWLTTLDSILEQAYEDGF